MQKTSVTRMELLARRAQLQLAEEGRDLLHQKRNALMQELMHAVNVVIEEAGHLDQILQDARQLMARAEIEAGTEVVQSAAIASISELPLKMESIRKMGVEILRFEQPRVARSMIGRGYAITNTPTAIDEAASAFEIAIESIIHQAENELRLTRLAKEIQRTARRLNVLDQILIPRLKAQISFIEKALNEQMRSDDFRFRIAKRLLQRKRAARTALSDEDDLRGVM